MRHDSSPIPCPYGRTTHSPLPRAHHAFRSQSSYHHPPYPFIMSFQCDGRAALRLARARETQRKRRPEATTKTTQKTTITPASCPAQFFRLTSRLWTASRASIGVRAAIADYGNERLACESSKVFQKVGLCNESIANALKRTTTASSFWTKMMLCESCRGTKQRGFM
jgi:hypothetical protein